MHHRRQSGFILPLALVLSSGLLLLAILAWRWEIDSLPRTEAARLNERARTTLLLNMPALLEQLEQQVLRASATTALVHSPHAEPDLRQPVVLDPDSGESTSLHSEDPAAGAGTIAFQSPLSGANLAADLISMDLPGAPVRQSIAWAAEDLNLMAPQSPPPGFWPLPAWDLAPVADVVPIGTFLDTVTGGSWQSLEWIPAGDPLPLSPQSSPALVPVVRGLGVRFGIFAAGSARNPEKTIRVRFFLEGELWNPYNRPLAVHPGSGLRSVLRVLFWNLPEIRLHNRSMGLSSNWMPLDNAGNSRSGDSGLHGYVRLPGTLGPGESLTFMEPDPGRQPQGLARTLLTGFKVRPADTIEIEFRQPPGGLYAACLPLDAAGPLNSALDGAGWFRAEAFPADWPNLRFNRADSGPRPFLLENGSLSFRLENAHIRAMFTSRVAEFPYMRDPRRARVVFHEPLPAPSGEWSMGSELVALDIERLDGPVLPTPASPALALFSWPEAAPQSVIEAMDLPQWPEGFRLGTANAVAINRLINDPGLPLARPSEPVRLEASSDPPQPYQKSFSVNQLSEDAWLTRLTESGHPAEGDSLRFAAYAFPDSSNPGDFRSWPEETLRTAAQAWTESIGLAPLKSPADLFDSGLLSREIPPNPGDDPLHPFLPLRGWLSQPPGAHGAAWILHVACRVSRDTQIQWTSARLWLLETRSPEGQSRFETIRFEWTGRQAVRTVSLR